MLRLHLGRSWRCLRWRVVQSLRFVLYESKGAAPPRQPAGSSPVNGRDPRAPALARLRAPPPLTGHASRALGDAVLSPGPPRSPIRAPAASLARWPPATPDPATPSGSCAPLWVRWLSGQARHERLAKRSAAMLWPHTAPRQRPRRRCPAASQVDEEANGGIGPDPERE